MLTLGNLMVGSLNFKTHLFKGFNDLAAAIIPGILRIDREVVGNVVGNGSRGTIFIFFKEEKLCFSPNVHCVTELFRLGQNPLEVYPRATFEGSVIGFVNITNHPGCSHTVFVPPGQNGEGVIVRLEIHIRFINPGKTIDRRTVEHHHPVQRLFDLALGDSHVFHEAEDVDELEAEETNIFCLNSFHNFFSGHIHTPFLVVFGRTLR